MLRFVVNEPSFGWISKTLTVWGHAFLAVWSLALLAFVSPAAAQQVVQCPALPNLESTNTSVDTKTALDVLSKIISNVGIDIDVRRERDSILKNNPRADQTIIVLTMASTLCGMIASDASLSGSQKAERFQKMMIDVMMRASGPAPLARTDEKQSRDSRDDPRRWLARFPILSHARDLSRGRAPVTRAADETDKPPLPSKTGFLRTVPFYINEANKYFVIVGSAPSEEAARKLLAQLKAKAPQYDFVLYAPYGSNTNFAIVMACRVPRSVALEALRFAQRDVAQDAFLWACRSSGDRC